jgi:hypothetical protein
MANTTKSGNAKATQALGRMVEMVLCWRKKKGSVEGSIYSIRGSGVATITGRQGWELGIFLSICLTVSVHPIAHPPGWQAPSRLVVHPSFYCLPVCLAA